jgi:hypothetical protein
MHATRWRHANPKMKEVRQQKDILYNSNHIKFYKMQTVVVVWEGGIGEEQDESFGGNEHVYYLDCSDNFSTGKHAYVKLNILNMLRKYVYAAKL